MLCLKKLKTFYTEKPHEVRFGGLVFSGSTLYNKYVTVQTPTELLTDAVDYSCVFLF